MILLLYNTPTLPAEHPDAASEAGVMESVEAVEAALRAAGHEVRRLGVGNSITALIDDLRRTPRPDVVFNLCEGLHGVGEGESYIAGLVELLGWSLTGSSPECLALARDKPRMKWLLRGAGLPTPEFHYFKPGEPLPLAVLERMLLSGPLIVKPAHEDASLGIGPDSVVTTMAALERQVGDIARRYGPVLVEQFIAGREFNAAIVALPEPRLLPLSEIRFAAASPLARLVTYDAKWSTGSAADLATQPCCPAEVDPHLAAEIGRVAIGAFQLAGCRDYARVDLRVDEHGRPWILEINSNPDLSPAAGLARALRVGGGGYGSFIVQMVEHVAQSRGKVVAATLPKTPREPGQRVTMRGLSAADVPRLVEILEQCGVFRPDEVAVGEEVLRDAVKQGPGGDYRVTVAVLDGRQVGWACHGLVPLTDATYDLYWIAVDPLVQGIGLGRQIVEHVAGELRKTGARWLLAETSATANYEPTRQFYLRTGFAELSNIPDFYRKDDGRLIFGLRVN